MRKLHAKEIDVGPPRRWLILGGGRARPRAEQDRRGGIWASWCAASGERVWWSRAKPGRARREVGRRAYLATGLPAVLLVAAAAAVVAALVLASRGQQLRWWQQGWVAAPPKAASGLAMGVGSCGWQGCSGGAGEEEDRRDGERKTERERRDRHVGPIG